MRMPECLFGVINPAVALLLRSPLHGLLSGSVMLLGFTGRRTGRRYTTPVRYRREGDRVLCFSDKSTQWWRNCRDGAAVDVLLQRRRYTGKATVYENAEPVLRRELTAQLERFPQDAGYHGVRLDAEKHPAPGDLELAVRHGVMVEIRLSPEGAS